MKLNIIKLTLNQLLLYGVHMGYIRKFLNRHIKPYLLGFKGKFDIFNLKYTHLQLKLLLHLIVNVISLRQKILIVNNYPEMGSLLPLVNFKRCFFLDGPWIGGFLTNYKKIRLYTDYATTKQPQLFPLTTLPSLVIFLNITANNWGMKECLTLNVPLSVITGSTFNLLNQTFYPIVANNQTLEVFIFYTNLLGNASQKGLIKEQFNVFNLNLKSWVNI